MFENCPICQPAPPVEVGDRVRRYGVIDGPVGEVFDRFEEAGEQWALVTWRLRGNQYTGSRTMCKAELVSGLRVSVKAKRPNAKAVGLDAAGGQSHTSDGLCVAVDTESRT